MREMEKIQGPTPEPPIELSKENDYWIYRGLYIGLRSENDPVTVRTLLIDIGKLIGLESPEWNKAPHEKWEDLRKLSDKLLGDTFWAPLIPEYLYSMGMESQEDWNLGDLDLLVANGRHFAEPLWTGLAKYVDNLSPGKVGIFNPVGHYNDDQPRVAGPRRLFRKIDTLVVMGSTQTQKGGSLEVISHVGRLVRNPDFANKIKNVAIVMPMYGGSRGHRQGQRDGLVYEIMETISNPKILGLPLIEAKLKLWWDVVRNNFTNINPHGLMRAILGKDLPKLKIVTVDIHNEELPRGKFIEMGLEFINADPAPELAEATLRDLRSNGLEDKKWTVIASDGGAISRNDRFAEELFMKSRKLEIIVGSIDKTRKVAGVVDSVRLGEFYMWRKIDGVLTKDESPISEEDLKEIFKNEEMVMIKDDDMGDTGGTNATDEAFMRSKINKIVYSITVATHAVLSKGVDVLDKIGSNKYIFTNTLPTEDLNKRNDVVVVDAAPAIARALDLA